MSKKETNDRRQSKTIGTTPAEEVVKVMGWKKYRGRMLAVTLFLSIGIFGAALKYIGEGAQRQNMTGSSVDKPGFFSLLNPFTSAPPPSPTPQLSKEYIYAAGKLLAVEDVNAASATSSDLAIWRASTGEWWVLNGKNPKQYYAVSWGTNGDTPVQADFDGDGKVDFSVVRCTANGNCTWWIKKSSDFGTYAVTFGQSGDAPVPADYDGDGKSDIAVYRSGTWYILQSSNNVTLSSQFGLSGDKPAPKDYDGDGRVDIGVWRTSNTTFYSQNSSNGSIAEAVFTQSSDKPVSADYDGDGRADYAIRNGATWIIRQSTNNQLVSVSWQQSSDVAVPNDYDGDGKVDIAVWRSSNGNWYIRQSALNGQLRQVAWGVSGDNPVPASYKW